MNFHPRYLVHVDRDQRLKLGPLDLGEVLDRLPDQHVEHLQELAVRVGHDFLLHLSRGKSINFVIIKGPKYENKSIPVL